MYQVKIESGPPRVITVRGKKHCQLNLTAEVTKIEDGKAFFGVGQITFKQDGATKGTVPTEPDGTAVYELEFPLTGEGTILIGAFFQASADGQKASTSKRITIPTARDREDRVSVKAYELSLNAVQQQIADNQYKFELTARLAHRHGDVANKEVVFLVGNTEVAKSLTGPGGETYAESQAYTSERFEKKLRFSARCIVHDHHIVVSNPKVETIPPAKPAASAVVFHKFRIIEVNRFQIAKGKHRFILKAKLTRTEGQNGTDTPVRNLEGKIFAITYESGKAKQVEVETAGPSDAAGEILAQTDVMDSREFDEPIYFSGETEINGKTIISNTWTDKIPGEPKQKEAQQARYRLSLSQMVQQKAQNQFAFFLTALLTKVEGDDQQKRQVRIPGAEIRFYIDNAPSDPVPTDPTGQAFFGTEAITAGEFEKRVRLSAQTEVNGQIIGSNVEIGVVPAVVVAKRPTAEVADLIVRCRGNAAEVMAVDKDKNPVPAKLSVVPLKKDVSIRKLSGEEIKPAELTDIPAGTSILFFHHKDKDNFMTIFATGAITKTQRIYPQTL